MKEKWMAAAGMLVACLLRCWGQDLPSGDWLADARSLGMGRALMASDQGPFARCERNSSGKCLTLFAKGMLPYGVATWGEGATGIRWERTGFTCQLNGNICGSGEKTAGLLFSHQAGEMVRYTVGATFYTVPGAKKRTLCAVMPQAGLLLTPLEKWQFGLWLSNLTLTKVNGTPFAADGHIGTVYEAVPDLRIVLEVEKSLQHPLFAHLGMEWVFVHPTDNGWQVAGRCGLKYPCTELTAGLGVTHTENRTISFHLAVLFDPSLGCTHAASAGFSF